MLDYEKFNPGEKATYQYLQEKGYSICDTRTDPELHEKMDYIGYIGKEKFGFEAKYDRRIHQSGQMVYELYHIKKNPDGDTEYITGWSDKTEADYICYYDIVNSVLYVLRMDQLRRYVKTRYLPCKYTNKDSYKTTYFKLITINDYEKVGYDVERYYIDRSRWKQLKFNDE